VKMRRKILRMRFAGAILAGMVILVCSPLFATADEIEAYCGDLNAGGDVPPATETTVYQISCLDGESISGTAQGQLSTGVFGATATVISNPSSFGVSAANDSGVYMGYFFDTPGLTSGTAVFDVTLDPTLSATGFGVAYIEVDPGQGITAPELLSGNTAFDITSSGPLTIPFSVPITDGTSGFGADIGFDFYMYADVGCYAGPGACSATADFLDPAAITGVTIYDANGNIVPGVSLTSQGGFTVAQAPVPEPNSFALMAAVFAGLLAIVKRQKRDLKASSFVTTR
jgi:hypothetical protein